MHPISLVLLLPVLAAPVVLGAQTANHNEERKAQATELNLILEPGPVVNEVPVSFVFHLTNVSQRDLHLPEPYVDCSNATPNGSVWLNESWQPPTGPGLGKGVGICDFVGSGLPAPPVTEVAKNWRVLKPGESYYIQATQAGLHFDASTPGVYTFSAVYLPPSLEDSQIETLEHTGIAIPHRKVTSSSLQYEKR